MTTHKEYRRSWIVGRSLMLELGYSVVLNCQLPDVPAEKSSAWREKWHELASGVWNPGTLLAYLAVLSDTMLETEYASATHMARQLTLQTATEKMAELGQRVGAELPAGLAGQEAFVDLCVRARIASHESEGLDWNPDMHFAERTRDQYRLLARVLADGDLADAFWRLLDEYHETFYSPWQKTRLEAMTWLEASTRGHLGGIQGSLSSADVNWLPSQHVLRKILAVSGEEGRTPATIFFWIDPFQLQSAVSVHPGIIAVSCGFKQDAETDNRQRTALLANRMKALGDPTRLAALAMIRHFGMDNTATAKLLGVSRPTVSTHLKILQEAGLVETTMVGRSARHHVNIELLRETVAELLKHLDICDPDDETGHK